MNLEERIRRLEERLAKRLIIRSVRTPEQGFRGRVEIGAHSILIEYREDTPGYFWGYELLEELLEHVEQGRPSAIIYEGGIQYVPTSLAALGQVEEPSGDDD